MDFSKVTSGYDAEIALDGRYLSYLLLLASDVGLIPATVTFGEDPMSVTIQQPKVDRTYELNSDPDITNLNSAFAVEILHGPPSRGDLRITLLLRVRHNNIEIPGFSLELFVRIGLASEREVGGPALAAITLSTELVDIDGNLVNFLSQRGYPRDLILTSLAPHITRELRIDGIGSSGRIQDIALRKLEPDGDAPAVFLICVNLMLRDGPQPDLYRPTRGDIALAQNILVPGSAITLATRPGLFAEFGDDAFYRQAEPTSGGFHYPITNKGNKIGHFVRIDAYDDSGGGGPHKLHVEIEQEYYVDWVPWDPNITSHLYIFDATDSEGVMTFNSDFRIGEGVLMSIVGFVLAFALVGISGGWSLALWVGVLGVELGAEVHAKLKGKDEQVEQKIDAALFDIAPNRFTYVRRRWDPFFTTHHQIGLRPGATYITGSGMAIYGTPVLTRAIEAAPYVVIREALRDDQGAANWLIYHVDGLEEALLTDVAPAAFRGLIEQPDPVGSPHLFRLSVVEARDRVSRGELLAAIPYLVWRIGVDEHGSVKALLVISKLEHDATRAVLIDHYLAEATIRITVQQEDDIRAEVIAEWDALGKIYSEDDVKSEVAIRLHNRIEEDVAAYEAGALADALDAALEPLLTFELSPDQFGRLQKMRILKILEYDLIHVTTGDKDLYYYRDHYDQDIEPPPANLADNLLSKPRYRVA